MRRRGRRIPRNPSSLVYDKRVAIGQRRPGSLRHFLAASAGSTLMSTHPQFELSESGGLPVVAAPSAGAPGYLVRIYPPGLAENLIPLAAGVTTIGREVTCDIEVVDDFISRHHATLELDDAGCWVVDHDCRNGTFVNDERIERRKLVAGDHIRIGNQIFKYLSADHPETQYHEAVYQMMTSDGLTSIANRRYFDDSFHRELARCVRHNRPIAVLLLDIDHFKRVNDLYGHLIGDECLKELCQRVRATVRTDDLFARIGGEEFALVLSETGREEALLVAERVRARIEAEPFAVARRLEVPLTVSIGVAHSDEAILRSTEEFLADADAQLYAAKNSGRNRVCAPARGATRVSG